MMVKDMFMWRFYSGICLGVRTDDTTEDYDDEYGKFMFQIFSRRITIILPFLEFGWEKDYCTRGINKFIKNKK